MKKILYNLLLLLVTVAALSGCEKEEENFRVTPQTQIIFNDNINLITASFPASGRVVLKISAPGATSVNVRVVTTSVNLGTLPIANGTATLDVTARSLRPTGTLPGSYSMRVDATLPDGTVETRFFTVVITA